MTSGKNAGKTWVAAEGFAVQGYPGGSLRKSLYLAAVVSTLHFASVSTIASAQVAPPAGALAGAVRQASPTREEIERTRQQTEAPRAPRLVVEGEIERAPCALDSPAYANLRTPIREAVFHNLQGISAEELKQSYASLLGPDKPVSTICTIRDAAATALRRKGYLAAVQVPVQKIENGTVTFEVLFARVVAIRVRGNAGHAERLLAGYLSHLTDDKIFNKYAAERYLLLAKDLPGYDVRLSLKPAGTNPGELVGEVSVTHTPFDATAVIQNYSAHSTGRWTGALGANYYGLFGGDRLSASVSSTAQTREQQIVQVGYDTRVGGNGLTLSGNFTYAWSTPTIDFGPNAAPGLALKERTLFATGEIRYPWIRTQKFSLVSAAGFDFLNQTVDLKPVQRLAYDRLRVAFLRLDFDAADVSETRAPRWRASGSLEFRQGLDIFDATPSYGERLVLQKTDPTFVPPSRATADPTASVLRASASIEYRFGNLTFAMLPRAQYAFDPVLSFEEYSGGNYSIGRGYDPGVITGDDGIGSSFELRYPTLAPFPKLKLAVQPFAFYDAAWTHNKSGKAAAIGIRNDHLMSGGAGIHALLNNRFRLDATVAVPFNRAGLETRNKNPRFLISLTSKLWPWDNR
jgi:hemolysin activation/secretion protein